MSKAQTTRDRLQECALRLFVERGFDGVTVEEIARDAGVSHMTFFRHFPTKESVVLDDPYDPVLAEAISSVDDRQPLLARVAGGIMSAWASLEPPEAEVARSRIELAASHPALRAKVWENNRRTEDIIVAALVDDGVPVTDARIAAGAVLGAITAALFDWAESVDGESLGDRVEKAMTIVSLATQEVRS